jgi:hypothetical protein
MAYVAVLASLALALFSAPVAGQADDPGCGTYPAKVMTSLYAGWSGCQLKRDGHKPLWHSLPEGVTQVTRFVFTEGHGAFYRVVTITEKTDGLAELVVSGSRRRASISGHERTHRKRQANLPTDEVARITRLGEETGAWEFEEGSWDGDEMFMHCQVLDMERANVDGYRHSSVNIGCNKPQRLMPLVDEIVRLAGLQTAYDGMLYY